MWNAGPAAVRGAGGVLVLLVLLAGLAEGAAAQAARWTLANGEFGSAVAETRAAGYAAVPVAALAALGAELDAVRAGTRVRIGGAELLLQAGTPFYTANGRVRQLIDAPYESGGTLYVPVQLLVDQLPALLGSGLAVDLQARSIRRAATRPVASAPPRPAPGAAAPAGSAASQPRAVPPAALPAAPPAQGRSPEPAPAAPDRRAGSAARRLVVIDAGHGGVDPGAQGPSGVREKDVALAVARRLFTLLREDPSLDVRMTRERDTLVALTDRTRLANRWRAEGQDALFMSIHTNAHDRRTVRGFETFFLSEAKTEDARRVAEMENAAQRYENPAQNLDPLSFILHDLRQNKYLRDSSAWAAMVQERLGAVHPGPNRGVKQAGFVVLNGAFMPAVLVELGFISHPEEEKLLASPEYQTRLARQLAAAVKDFFTAASATAAAP